MLFMRIRGETIKFATTLKKENKIREKTLLEDIDHLERIQDETGTNSKLMEDKKLELQKLRENRIKGQMVRSHLQWLDQGEKPTNFFCKLETKNFVDKTIKKVQTADSSVITEQHQILKEVQKFYSNLFKSKDNSLGTSDISEMPELQNIKKISQLNMGRKCIKKDEKQ